MYPHSDNIGIEERWWLRCYFTTTLYKKLCFRFFFFFFGCQTGESEGSEKAIRRTARPKTRWIFEPVDLKRKAAYRMAP